MLTLADIRRRARDRLYDVVEPYLWSDAELLDHINDALRDACIRASLTVEDDVSFAFTQKADLTWNATYALPSGTLDVRSAYLLSSPYNTLRKTSFRRQEQYHGSRPDSSQTGTPYAYTVDRVQAGTGDDQGIFVRTITLVGNPTEADTVKLEIVRLPLLLEDDSDVPEVDEIWHPDLIYGVTSRAYMKNDELAYHPDRAASEGAIFEERFGPRIPASVIRERQTEVPYEMTLA